MADKKMNDFAPASDGAYIYAESASGEQIKISKADLASVVAGLLPVKLRFQEFKNVLASTEVGPTLAYAGIFLVSCPETGYSMVFVNGSQTLFDDTIFLKSHPNAGFTVEPDSISAIAVYKKEINGKVFLKNNYNYPVTIRLTSLSYF